MTGVIGGTSRCHSNKQGVRVGWAVRVNKQNQLSVVLGDRSSRLVRATYAKGLDGCEQLDGRRGYRGVDGQGKCVEGEIHGIGWS
jgi:hypothetical protein